MEDLINRQAAIDALAKFVPYAICDESTESYTNGLTDAYNLILQLPSAQPELDEWCTDCKEYDQERHCCPRWNRVIRQTLKDAELERKKERWIPCSEQLPEDIRPVIVTWKNTDPKSYYQYIVGKHYTGTACYKNGKWYWYSSTTEDMLAEYGRYDSEEFDEAIECIAWMPLPEAYGGQEDE